MVTFEIAKRLYLYETYLLLSPTALRAGLDWFRLGLMSFWLHDSDCTASRCGT